MQPKRIERCGSCNRKKKQEWINSIAMGHYQVWVCPVCDKE